MSCQGVPVRFTKYLLILTLASGLSACPSAQPPAPEAPAQAPTALQVPQRNFPGARTYQVLGEESRVRILAYRAGSLKSAGHNHVIASHDVHGLVYLHDDAAKSGFDLVMPVNLLEVDNEELRSQEGADFSASVSESSKEGTRRNMLSEALLDGEHYPGISVSSVSMEGRPEALLAHARVKVKDREQEMAIPVVLERKNGRVVATGEFELKQSDFGITPFSIMLGAVQVADQVKVKFHIVAAEGTAGKPQP